MGATQSATPAAPATPLEGGSKCSSHGTNKKACQQDPRCHRSHHKCVPNTACQHLSKKACQQHPHCRRHNKKCVPSGPARPPASPCQNLSKKACRRNKQCQLSDKTCIRKPPAHAKTGYYHGDRVRIVRNSEAFPGHYVIQFVDGIPYQASVPWSDITSTPPASASAAAASVGYSIGGLPSNAQLLERMADMLHQYHTGGDEAEYRPSCSPGVIGDLECQEQGYPACGSVQHPFRCNPEATLQRWKTASSQKCEERCASQPERTYKQADMKRRCYRNCRSRAQ